jgi:hypothetical protein
LIEALVAHDGVGLVMIRCQDRPPIVFSKQGARELDPDGVQEGDDPLGQYGEHAHTFFRRLAEYEYAGDIVVNGAYDDEKRWVIGFDDLVGAHGGLGGPQTQPFLMYPSAWTDEAPKLVGSVDVHHFLKRHTSESPPPPAPGSSPYAGEPPPPAPPRCEGEGSKEGERVAWIAERAEQPAATGDDA